MKLKLYIINIMLCISCFGYSYAATTTIGLTILPSSGSNNTGTVTTGGVFTGISASTNSGSYAGGGYSNPALYNPIPSLGTAQLLSGFIATGSQTDNELMRAYEWAKKHGITTMPTIEKARLMQPLTRAELAKMIVQFSRNVMGNTINTNNACVVEQYKDHTIMDKEEKTYIKLACDADIMGWKNDKTKLIEYFRPHDLVTRAELSAVLSRFLFGNKYEGDTTETRYKKHLQALFDTKYMMKIDTPFIRELRGYVLIIFHRIATK